MLYQTGHSRARPYTIGVDVGELLLCDKTGRVIDVLNPAEWDLKLDGVDDDYLILQDLARGQRLVCDIKFLGALIEGIEHQGMLTQAKSIKNELRSRSPAEASATALLGVLVLGFASWLGFGFPVAMNAYKTQVANAPVVIPMTRSEQEDYVMTVSRAIQKKWKPPECDDDRASLLRFDVNREGRVQNIKLIRSSGDGAFDDKAKSCLRGAQFNPLPDNLGDSVPLEFTFAYKRPSYSMSP